MAKSDKYPEDWESRRVAALHRAGYRCSDCGEEQRRGRLHVDHVTAISDGGGHELDNLRVLCSHCHADRHDTQVCDACHLLGRFVLDEIKKHGTVGLCYFCEEHYSQVAESPYTDDEGRCGICGQEASGRYTIADHGPHHGALGSTTVCQTCRKNIVHKDEIAREELSERFRFGVSDNE